MEEEFDNWIDGGFPEDEDGTHLLALLEEDPNLRNELWNDIQIMVRRHYVPDDVIAKRLAAHGASKTAALLRDKLPTTKKARSGEMGEILATEMAERRLGWHVPVRRLRWKDGRDIALRGDDLTAIWLSDEGELWFLKGESKSRAGSISAAVHDATEALDRDQGRPSRISVLFVAEQLREQMEDELAVKIEEALTRSFVGYTINHLLFTLTGTDPKRVLEQHFGSLGKRNRKRYVLGVRIVDHEEFIESIYEAL